MDAAYQSTERISLEDFISRIEKGLLFPLTDRERLEAVRLAKLYTGRIVIEQWKKWRERSAAGFLLFGKELPDLLRQEETERLEREREVIRENATKKAGQERQDVFPELANPFEELWSRLKGKRDSTSGWNPPVEQHRPARSSELKGSENKVKEWIPKAGYMDPEQGWCIGGMPVF